MNVTINGEDKKLEDAATVASLIDALGLGEKRVAVEVNRRIIPKAHWNNTGLSSDDRVEIVQFVGGG